MLAESQPFIGVNYGQVANNLLPSEAMTNLLKSTTIGEIHLYDTDPGIIKALGNSSIGIVVGTANGDILHLASDPDVTTKWMGDHGY